MVLELLVMQAPPPERSNGLELKRMSQWRRKLDADVTTPLNARESRDSRGLLEDEEADANQATFGGHSPQVVEPQLSVEQISETHSDDEWENVVKRVQPASGNVGH